MSELGRHLLATEQRISDLERERDEALEAGRHFEERASKAVAALAESERWEKALVGLLDRAGFWIAQTLDEDNYDLWCAEVQAVFATREKGSDG